jgi:hypothetical protein
MVKLAALVFVASTLAGCSCSHEHTGAAEEPGLSQNRVWPPPKPDPALAWHVEHDHTPCGVACWEVYKGNCDVCSDDEDMVLCGDQALTCEAALAAVAGTPGLPLCLRLCLTSG